MKITCPECGFSRDVPRERLPGSHVIATCPKCKAKFRLNVENGAAGQDEEDIRQIADRAYRHEAERFSHADEKGDKGAAWEQWPQVNWFTAFFATITRVMFSAAQFFRSLPQNAPLSRALGFFLIIVIFQTIVERLWVDFFISVLAPGAVDDPQLDKMLKLLASQSGLVMTLILKCGLMLAQLYFFALLLFVPFRFLAPGRASYNLFVQILAYSVAPMILCAVPLLGSLVGMIWSLVCMVSGCRAALGLDWTKTLTGFLPLLCLLAPFIMGFFEMLKA